MSFTSSRLFNTKANVKLNKFKDFLFGWIELESNVKNNPNVKYLKKILKTKGVIDLIENYKMKKEFRLLRLITLPFTFANTFAKNATKIMK